MIEFIEEFCNKLSANSFWPLVVFSVILLLLCLYGLGVKEHSDFGSVEWRDATWRNMASAQGLGIAWILWILVSAIPSPNYITQIETRHSSFWQVFHDCNNENTIISDDLKITPEQNAQAVDMRERRMQTCRQIALDAQKN